MPEDRKNPGFWTILARKMVIKNNETWEYPVFKPQFKPGKLEP